MLYNSTRGKEKGVLASEAILKGLATDGGLFVPEQIPALELDFDMLKKMSYKEVAYHVMSKFFTDFSKEELMYCIDKAYDEKFDTSEITPIKEIGNTFFLELFHGSTIAFKDMALSILPYLMTVSAKKNNVKNEIVILTATSGDTGKAALAGFGGVEGTKIIVFYPKGGVSMIQEKQMLTQKDENTCVIGIRGNFDEAQSGVKALFGDQLLNEEMNDLGFQFSSANSINIGRLVPQIVYYIYTYGKLLSDGKIYAGEKINFVVPTGNFGNILAGYYAKEMGLPVNKLICASNDNKVLYDFLISGEYDKNREFILTSSPSMDILISSNLERLIYKIADESAKSNNNLMESLKKTGKYSITKEMKNKLGDFYGDYATQEEASAKIKGLFENSGYIIDTHTAVAASVYDKYRDKTGDLSKTVVVSTASPFKFVQSVMESISEQYIGMEDFELVDRMSEIGNVSIPKAIEEIRHADIIHQIVCNSDEMEIEVRRKIQEW